MKFEELLICAKLGGAKLKNPPIPQVRSATVSPADSFKLFIMYSQILAGGEELTVLQLFFRLTVFVVVIKILLLQTVQAAISGVGIPDLICLCSERQRYRWK